MMFHHVCLQVSSAKVSVPFYQNIFQFEILRTFEKDDWGKIVHLRRKDENFVLEIIDGAPITTQKEKFHIAFLVQELAELLEKAERFWGTILEKPYRIGNEEIAFIGDPDGWRIELNTNLPI